MPVRPSCKVGRYSYSQSTSIQPLVEPLSERELQVLALAAAGQSNRESAQELLVTSGTVKRHMHHICGKLGVRNRTEAAARAGELDLLLGVTNDECPGDGSRPQEVPPDWMHGFAQGTSLVLSECGLSLEGL